MSVETIVIGANPQPLRGPGKLVHQGGDPILIAPVVDGLPGVESTLVHEGNEVVIDGDDEFQPKAEDERTHEFDGTILVRALGQANADFSEDVEPEPKPEAKKPAAKKRAAKKRAAKEVADIAA